MVPFHQSLWPLTHLLCERFELNIERGPKSKQLWQKENISLPIPSLNTANAVVLQTNVYQLLPFVHSALPSSVGGHSLSMQLRVLKYYSQPTS